jgi:molybdopterin synthase sulfur carrier subunit
MPTLRVPALMKSYVENQTEVSLSGATVAQVLNDLVTRHPAIRIQIMDKNGELRRYVNLFVNEVNIKDLKGLETPLGEADKIILLPSISGG